MLLAFDTSGLSCSVALRAGERLWTAVSSGDPQHSRQLLPMLEQLLAEAGHRLEAVTALAYGRGPGSFTGIRVAAGLAQGLGYSLNIPVLPVSTLAALARQAWRRHGARHVLAALDARLGELYLGGYEVSDAGTADACIEERVGTEALLAEAPEKVWFGIGSGWQVAGERLRATLCGSLSGVDPAAIPLAEDIAALALSQLAASSGQGWPAEAAQPVYLRDRVAHGA